MTPEAYEAFRDELVLLLQDATVLSCIPEDKKAALHRICKKTRENQFEIVLAGEFQGGKSTTFNAFCDGRELSPRGSGVKTSGCIVSAQNLADPDEPERAVIEWKTSRELVSGFSDLLFSHLKSFSPKRFENSSASDIDAEIDLSDKSDRALVAQAAREEWRLWEKYRLGYDPDNRGKLDILRMAALVSRFFGDEELTRLQRSEIEPEEAGSMGAFPADWEDRWLEGDPSLFRPSEILFLFIRSVRIKIRSKHLSRLGCAVTDCPGLFASRWDTEIARTAMLSADAILYLFDGSRTLKNSDLRALRFIRDNGMMYKTLYGCNMRGLSLENSRRIAVSTVDQLNRMNFSVNSEDFSLFHALLALLSVQCGRFYHDRRTFCRDAVRRILQILEIEENEAADDDAVIQIARRASGWDDLLKTVENRIIQKKARLILIDHGAQPAVSALTEAEGMLKIREAAALKKEKEFCSHLETVENQLKQFKDRCFLILSRLDDPAPDTAMAEDIRRRIRAEKEILLETVTDRIYQDILSVSKVGSLFSRSKLADRISGVIAEETEARIKSVIAAWLSDIRDGRHEVYNVQFVKTIRSVSADLKKVWESSGLPEENWLEGISIPEFSGDILLDQEKLFQEIGQSQLFDAMTYQAISAGAAAGLFSATSGLAAAGVMAATKALRLVAASAALLIVNLAFLLFARNMIENMLRDEIRAGLSNVFANLFKELGTQIGKEFMTFSAGIRDHYKYLFISAVERPRRAFEVRKQTADEVFRKSRQERLAVAGEAKNVRETQIAPILSRIGDFVRRVEDGLSCE